MNVGVEITDIDWENLDVQRLGSHFKGRLDVLESEIQRLREDNKRLTEDNERLSKDAQQFKQMYSDSQDGYTKILAESTNVIKAAETDSGPDIPKADDGGVGGENNCNSTPTSDASGAQDQKDKGTKAPVTCPVKILQAQIQKHCPKETRPAHGKIGVIRRASLQDILTRHHQKRGFPQTRNQKQAHRLQINCAALHAASRCQTYASHTIERSKI